MQDFCSKCESCSHMSTGNDIFMHFCLNLLELLVFRAQLQNQPLCFPEGGGQCGKMLDRNKTADIRYFRCDSLSV